jgi:hypothetical protein
MSERVEENPPNWDPAEDDRVYYRHSMTGDRGYLVRRAGKDCIRLDRAQVESVQPLTRGTWEPEGERRPFTRTQVCMIAFEADRKLCHALGLYGLARLEWQSLSQEVRKAWVLEGPAKPPIRHDLYKAVFETLAHLMES